MITIKKAVMKIISSFDGMGKISKLVTKLSFIVFCMLAIPSMITIAVFAKSSPNPDFFFICKNMFAVGGQVLTLGVIGGVLLNHAFHR